MQRLVPMSPEQSGKDLDRIALEAHRAFGLFGEVVFDLMQRAAATEDGFQVIARRLGLRVESDSLRQIEILAEHIKNVGSERFLKQWNKVAPKTGFGPAQSPGRAGETLRITPEMANPLEVGYQPTVMHTQEEKGDVRLKRLLSGQVMRKQGSGGPSPPRRRAADRTPSPEPEEHPRRRASDRATAPAPSEKVVTPPPRKAPTSPSVPAEPTAESASPEASFPEAARAEPKTDEERRSGVDRRQRVEVIFFKNRRFGGERRKN